MTFFIPSANDLSTLAMKEHRVRRLARHIFTLFSAPSLALSFAVCVCGCSAEPPNGAAGFITEQDARLISIARHAVCGTNGRRCRICAPRARSRFIRDTISPLPDER